MLDFVGFYLKRVDLQIYRTVLHINQNSSWYFGGWRLLLQIGFFTTFYNMFLIENTL